MASGIELAPLLTKIKVDIASFKTDMEQVKTEAVSKANEVSKQMEKTIKVGENMSKLGGTLTKTVSLPLIGVGTAATKMAVDFESSFAKVSTLLDSNVVDYGKYKNEMLDASSASKIAIEQFSEAVYQSISAGVDQTKAIDFTTQAMKLAKGGFTDGAKAVDVLTTAINVYGLTAKDVNRVSDALITTQNLGKTTVDELASSIGQVLPITAQLNLSFEDTMSIMATLTKNGIGTSQAVTGLKAALSNIIKPTSEAAEAADALGIDFSAAALQSKGLVPFLDDIKTALKSAAPEFASLSENVAVNKTKLAELEAQGLKSSDQYKVLKKETDGMEKSMETLAQASDSTIGGFATLFGSVEGLNSMMVLTSETGAKDLNNIMESMYNSAGATQTAFEKIDATPAERMKGALNELKNSGIKLGQSLIPVVEKIADVIGDVAEWLSKLTPEQQQSILKWGAMAIAIGPVLKVTGGLVTTYGKLKPLLSGTGTILSKGVPLLGKLGTSLGNVGLKMMDCGGITAKLGTALASAATSGGGFITSLGGLASVALPWVAGAAAIGTAAYGVYKVLNTEVIPEVDLFKDKVVTTYNDVGDIASQTMVKISDSTKTAVQAYIDMDDQVSREMYQMKVNNTNITNEIANNMTSKFNEMGDSIIAKQNETTQNSLTKLNEFFAETGGVTDENEQAILNSIQTKHGEQVATVEQCKTRIQEIYQNAANQNRAITEQEQQEINDIQSQMRDNAITTFSETEAEAAVIRQRMKDYQGRLSVEMASEMIQKANEAKTGEITAANEKYEGIVKEASKLKQAGLITEEEYNYMITSAEEARQQQIQKAEEACDGIKTEIQDATPGIEEKVNMQTGKVKTAWDQLSGWASGVFDWLTQRSDMVASQISGVGGSWSGGPRLSHYNGLDYVPYDGYNARLHEGERVLTKEENQAYSKGNAENKQITVEVPVIINGRKFAIATKEFNQEELAF